MKHRHKRHTRVFLLLLIIAPFVYATTQQQSTSDGILSFKGEIISLDNNAQPTVILTRNDHGHTVYVMKNIATEWELAKFTTVHGAKLYAARLTQSQVVP